VPFKLSDRSRKTLVGVHPVLVRVVEGAIVRTPVDFVVIEGLRTKERQAELLKAGASWTMNSRHLTGHAVDLGAWLGTIRWEWPLYEQIADAMFAAAAAIDAHIEWGGDWKRRDGPHFQLARRWYP
jgi:peptidoglycan L-alanyl-D-glutamate endopeptidase CwlK